MLPDISTASLGRCTACRAISQPCIWSCGWFIILVLNLIMLSFTYFTHLKTGSKSTARPRLWVALMVGSDLRQAALWPANQHPAEETVYITGPYPGSALGSAVIAKNRKDKGEWRRQLVGGILLHPCTHRHTHTHTHFLRKFNFIPVNVTQCRDGP